MIEDYRAKHPNPMRVFVPAEQVSTGGYRPTLDWSEAGKPPRLQLAILVGEFSYNLRAALDYLVHQLAALDGAAPRFRNFPIELDPKKWQKRRTTWLKGIRDEHVKVVERHQPFAGAHWLHLLKTINNPDKHQALTVVVSEFTGELSISKDKLVPVPGDDDRLELQQDNQNIAFHLIDRLPLEASLHILLFEMAKLLDDFRPIFGDKSTFTVNDPHAAITSGQHISTDAAT